MRSSNHQYSLSFEDPHFPVRRENKRTAAGNANVMYLPNTCMHACCAFSFQTDCDECLNAPSRCKAPVPESPPSLSSTYWMDPKVPSSHCALRSWT